MGKRVLDQRGCMQRGNVSHFGRQLVIMGVLGGLGGCNAYASKTAPLPLPRFASIRAKKVNIHVGPGTQYPSVWQIVRPGLPVEITAEFDTWRKIKDFDNTEGWVHKSMLCGVRTICFLHTRTTLRDQPTEGALIKAYIEPQVIARVVRCDQAWCEISLKSQNKSQKGWVLKKQIWGVYDHESQFK